MLNVTKTRTAPIIEGLREIANDIDYNLATSGMPSFAMATPAPANHQNAAMTAHEAVELIDRLKTIIDPKEGVKSTFRMELDNLGQSYEGLGEYYHINYDVNIEHGKVVMTISTPWVPDILRDGRNRGRKQAVGEIQLRVAMNGFKETVEEQEPLFEAKEIFVPSPSEGESEARKYVDVLKFEFTKKQEKSAASGPSAPSGTAVVTPLSSSLTRIATEETVFSGSAQRVNTEINALLNKNQNASSNPLSQNEREQLNYIDDLIRRTLPMSNIIEVVITKYLFHNNPDVPIYGFNITSSKAKQGTFKKGTKEEALDEIAVNAGPNYMARFLHLRDLGPTGGLELRMIELTKIAFLLGQLPPGAHVDIPEIDIPGIENGPLFCLNINTLGIAPESARITREVVIPNGPVTDVLQEISSLRESIIGSEQIDNDERTRLFFIRELITNLPERARVEITRHLFNGITYYGFIITSEGDDGRTFFNGSREEEDWRKKLPGSSTETLNLAHRRLKDLEGPINRHERFDIRTAKLNKLMPPNVPVEIRAHFINNENGPFLDLNINTVSETAASSVAGSPTEFFSGPVSGAIARIKNVVGTAFDRVTPFDIRLGHVLELVENLTGEDTEVTINQTGTLEEPIFSFIATSRSPHIQMPFFTGDKKDALAMIQKAVWPDSISSLGNKKIDPRVNAGDQKKIALAKVALLMGGMSDDQRVRIVDLEIEGHVNGPSYYLDTNSQGDEQVPAIQKMRFSSGPVRRVIATMRNYMGIYQMPFSNISQLLDEIPTDGRGAEVEMTQYHFASKPGDMFCDFVITSPDSEKEPLFAGSKEKVIADIKTIVGEGQGNIKRLATYYLDDRVTDERNEIKLSKMLIQIENLPPHTPVRISVTHFPKRLWAVQASTFRNVEIDGEYRQGEMILAALLTSGLINPVDEINAAPFTKLGSGADMHLRFGDYVFTAQENEKVYEQLKQGYNVPYYDLEIDPQGVIPEPAADLETALNALPGPELLFQPGVVGATNPDPLNAFGVPKIRPLGYEDVDNIQVPDLVLGPLGEEPTDLDRGLKDDAAMIEPKTNSRAPARAISRALRGGIDLNTSNGMRWKVSRDGKGVEMDINPAMLAQIRKYGVKSISVFIFKITPVTNVLSLAGL